MHGYDITGASHATSPCTGSAAPGRTARSCRTHATWRSSSARCCAGSSCRPRSSPRCGRLFRARTGTASASSGSARLAAAGSTETPGGTPGYLTFAAGSRDGRRLYVIACERRRPRAMEAIAGPYLDDLLCRESALAVRRRAGRADSSASLTARTSGSGSSSGRASASRHQARSGLRDLPWKPAPPRSPGRGRWSVARPPGVG